MEGYDGNRLSKAIPFVCKILEQSAMSVVFVQPNPWLMGVLGLLAELYQFADLRLNLKFEIEVLCKALRINLDKLELATVLRDHSAIMDNVFIGPEDNLRLLIVHAETAQLGIDFNHLPAVKVNGTLFQEHQMNTRTVQAEQNHIWYRKGGQLLY